MKKYFYPLLTVCVLLTSAVATIPTQDYKIKEGFKVEFKSKDPSGIFKILKGIIKFDEADLENSKFISVMPVASISTGNGMMNKKALTEEWFDAGKYPEIKYVSSKIEKSGSDYIVYGSLTIKGVTKDKKVPLKVTKSGTDLVFSGSFGVNRMDYKVGKPSDAVPDIMNITYSIPVSKK